MILTVKRLVLGETSTLGKLYVDGTYTCFTLEDKVRIGGVKVPGQTAIPQGTYHLVIDHSNHFNRDLPHVLDVPGFTGVRIHPGNTAADTEGCILVGEEHEGCVRLNNSRKAFDSLFSQLLDNKGEEPHMLTIIEEDSREVA